MALLTDYINDLKAQKELIKELSNSGPSIKGLTIDEILLRLAELDENLTKTIEYYNAKAEADAKKEEEEAANSGVQETDQQKEERRRKKREEAAKKIKETTDRFIETQRDYVQEQIAIIRVNWGVVQEETSEIPQIIPLAIATAAQPAAVGAAVPNPFYNIGVLFQTLKAIKRSLNNIKAAFLNILIAADKIKLALPKEVTETFAKILSIQELLGKTSPPSSDFDQAPPAIPAGVEVILNVGQYEEFRDSNNVLYARVIQKGILGAPQGTTGVVVDYIRNAQTGEVTGIKIRVETPLNQSSQSEGNSGSSSSFEPS